MNIKCSLTFLNPGNCRLTGLALSLSPEPTQKVATLIQQGYKMVQVSSGSTFPRKSASDWMTGATPGPPRPWVTALLRWCPPNAPAPPAPRSWQLSLVAWMGIYGVRANDSWSVHAGWISRNYDCAFWNLNIAIKFGLRLEVFWCQAKIGKTILAWYVFFQNK